MQLGIHKATMTARALSKPKCAQNIIGVGSSRNAKTSAAMVILSLIFLTLTACTVTPLTVKPLVASFDGTNQNSGIVARNADGSYVITAHKRDRYNALVADYGAEFRPALKPDDGLEKLPDGNWRI